MIVFSSIALVLIVLWLIWQFLQFLYDFKFIRDLILQTKVANKIYP
jgi:membrane associated rhomboid family serine protease